MHKYVLKSARAKIQVTFCSAIHRFNLHIKIIYVKYLTYTYIFIHVTPHNGFAPIALLRRFYGDYSYRY